MSEVKEGFPPPSWDNLAATLIFMATAATFGGFIVVMFAPTVFRSAQAGEASLSWDNVISSLTFVVAMLALAFQATQTRQSNQIAEATAELQFQTMLDTKRDRMNRLLSDVTEAVHIMYANVHIYRERQELAARNGGAEEQEKLRLALTDVLLVDARIAALRTSLVTTLPIAGATLRSALHGWIELVKAITKRDSGETPTISVMTHEALQGHMQQRLFAVLEAIGEVLKSGEYQGSTSINAPENGTTSSV